MKDITFPLVEVQYLGGERKYLPVEKAKLAIRSQEPVVVLTNSIIRGSDFEVDRLLEDEVKEIRGLA
jgi:hypothetical protein